MTNYYELLEVRKDATSSEIRVAYKKKVHKCHPDLNGNGDAETFKKLIKANKALGDAVSRAEYDNELKSFNLSSKEREKLEKESKSKEKKSLFNRKKINKNIVSASINKLVNIQSRLKKNVF